MEKNARKRSADPLQEKLREDKDQWNKGVSLFIEELKQFKKLMNGYASKFHMEKSKIIEPIPGDPSSILNELSGSFRDLAVKSQNIVQEQMDYSQHRRQKQLKTPKGMTPADNLSKQLGASMDYLLVSEGSNALTRWWSRLKLPWFRGPEKRKKEYRLQLLDTSVELQKRYKLLQSDILKSSNSKLEEISKLITRIERDISSMEADLIAYAAHVKQTDVDVVEKPETEKSKPAIHKSITKLPPIPDHIRQEVEQPKAPPVEIEVDETIIKAAKEAILDIVQNKNDFLEFDGKLMKIFRMHTLELEAISQQPLAGKDMIEKASRKLLSAYNDLIGDLSQKLKVPGSSLVELRDNRDIFFQKKPKIAHDSNLELCADKIVNKWFNKLAIFGSTKSKVNRRDIFNIAKHCLVVVNELMDSLESDLDIAAVSAQLKQLKDNNKLINTTFKSLKIKMQDLRQEKIMKGK